MAGNPGRDGSAGGQGRHILFVCLGNICRSPLAEGIFLHHVRGLGLAERYRADSAGIGGWHVGCPPDPRALDIARVRGIHLPSLGRQVKKADFSAFDLVLAMDRANKRDLLALCPAPFRHKIRLMREFDPNPGFPGDDEVPDPYYGDAGGFARVFDMLERSSSGLCGHLEREYGRNP